MKSQSSPRSQRGVVLVISLLLLLVLTLIGLAATRSTTLEERMTSNQRDQDVAFQAAEAALRDGESALQAASPGQFNNTNGLYDSSSTVTYTDQSVWDSSTTNSIVYSGTLTPAPSQPPRYYIMQSASSGPANGQSLLADAPTVTPTIYLVVAKGYGLSPNTVVYLQSSYQR
ncbi:MAG TPA: PilX N-terminal domain-containing pilus assembly protein [Gammaproteobacteria bacterium]|nr:PilX N-terminal domain-containing pilus assembly protein [Gammaproteobacteria bacterium]